MTKKNTTKPSGLDAAILEMAHDMREGGVIDDAVYEKITMRQLGPKSLPTATPITADEIRQVREDAHVSQAVFARYLNVSTGYIAQLERGSRQPSGAALALLNVVRRKGLEAIL